MKINFKTKIKTHQLECTEEDTIASIKERLEKEFPDLNISHKDMKLIAVGKILKDDQKIKDYSLADGTTVLITGLPSKQKEEPKNINAAQPAYTQPAYTQPSNNSSNNLMQNAMEQQIDQMLNDPSVFDMYFGQMMQGKSEEEKQTYKNMIMAQMEAFKNNPELMKSVMNQMGNMDPRTMQSMLSGQGMPQPPMSAGMGFPGMAPPPQYPAYQQPFVQQQASPTIPCSHGYVPNTKAFHEMRFANQLNALSEMGYQNREKNLAALFIADGDINFAIGLIHEWSGN